MENLMLTIKGEPVIKAEDTGEINSLSNLPADPHALTDESEATEGEPAV
jgi:hypothetical protein